ncbi:MAG: hypothetical protein M9939_26345 [Mesorhizobium sp.]|nr:hypothetical protein [Mesorhizobium sp.]MCO5164613.1 hypothetical protein [Mesorhizobium sp.]
MAKRKHHHLMTDAAGRQYWVEQEQDDGGSWEPLSSIVFWLFVIGIVGQLAITYVVAPVVDGSAALLETVSGWLN